MAKEEKTVSIRTEKGEGKNKIEKNITVEEIKNGFLVTESKNWRDKDGNYQYSTEKYYSKTDPLSETTEKNLKQLMLKNMPGA